MRPGRQRDEGTQIIVAPVNRRVIRYRVDQVGNDLTAVLRWCSTHSEPVWLYGDGSSTCPYDTVTQTANEHTLTDGPWEAPCPTTTSPRRTGDTMSDEPEKWGIDDSERWERDDLREEAAAAAAEPVDPGPTEPPPDEWPTETDLYPLGCRRPCDQCDTLRPVLAELSARQYDCWIETRLGGGMHAIRINLLDGRHTLLNDECFSFYDNEDDDDGHGHFYFSTDDPPNARQMAILFDLKATIPPTTHQETP